MDPESGCTSPDRRVDITTVTGHVSELRVQEGEQAGKRTILSRPACLDSRYDVLSCRRALSLRCISSCGPVEHRPHSAAYDVARTGARFCCGGLRSARPDRGSLRSLTTFAYVIIELIGARNRHDCHRRRWPHACDRMCTTVPACRDSLAQAGRVGEQVFGSEPFAMRCSRTHIASRLAGMSALWP